MHLSIYTSIYPFFSFIYLSKYPTFTLTSTLPPSLTFSTLLLHPNPYSLSFTHILHTSFFTHIHTSFTHILHTSSLTHILLTPSLTHILPPPPAVVKHEEPTLRLQKVSRRDMGAYLCIASNGVPPSVSKRIELKVQCKYDERHVEGK